MLRSQRSRSSQADNQRLKLSDGGGEGASIVTKTAACGAPQHGKEHHGAGPPAAPEEEPVAGARVNVFTDFDVFSTVTSAEGSFSVAGVPTVDGDLRVGAWAEVAGVLHTGRSSFAAPNPGG